MPEPDLSRIGGRDGTLQHKIIEVFITADIWRNAETGAVIGETDIASRFLVEQQQVVQYVRYDDLEGALHDAGLTHADEQIAED